MSGIATLRRTDDVTAAVDDIRVQNEWLASIDEAGWDPKLVAAAREFFVSSRSKNTRRAIGYRFRTFANWCSERGLHQHPNVEAVIFFLADYASKGYKWKYIDGLAYAISTVYKDAGFPDPLRDRRVRQLLKGIARLIGTASEGVDAATPELIQQMVEIARKESNVVRAVRDVAWMTLQSAGGFRMNCLVGANIESCDFDDHGVTITLDHSKTDTMRAGESVYVWATGKDLTCPVLALKRWLRLLKDTEGPLFRKVGQYGHIGPERLHDHSAGGIVARYVMLAGTDLHIATHSFRAYCATESLSAGVPEIYVMRQMRIKSIDTLVRYFRPKSWARFNISQAIGL